MAGLWHGFNHEVQDWWHWLSGNEAARPEGAGHYLIPSSIPLSYLH